MEHPLKRLTEDVQELLERLEEQERHPDLGLIKALLDQGQAIVPALITILEDDDYYGPYATKNIWTPVHAANILCELRAVEALPALRRAMTRPGEDGMAEWISEGLVKFGPAALDTAEAILRDKTLDWYPRAMAAEALKAIAQHYPETYERVTATMRSLLPDPAIDFSRYESYEQVKAELDDSQIWESLVSDLCDLQDPQAYDLIASMFDRGLIWEGWMGREDFEDAYARPARAPRIDPHKDLLTMYRELRPPERPRPRPAATETKARPQPVRVRKIGRNEPCWCGSGKKYKHCHLRQDRQRRAGCHPPTPPTRRVRRTCGADRPLPPEPGPTPQRRPAALHLQRVRPGRRGQDVAPASLPSHCRGGGSHHRLDPR